MTAGAMPMANPERIKVVKEKAEVQLAEHAQLSVELAAIQKELERRVSMAKPRRGKPWNSPDQSS